MARASQTTQVPASGAMAPTLTAPAVSPNGDVVDAGDSTYVWVHNGSGAPINVTVTATALVDGLVVPNRVVAVAAGADALVGPLYGRTFGQLTTDAGRVYVDYSAVATVTRAVVKL